LAEHAKNPPFINHVVVRISGNFWSKFKNIRGPLKRRQSSQYADPKIVAFEENVLFGVPRHWDRRLKNFHQRVALKKEQYNTAATHS
jgi:hypothetical protein